MKTMRKGEKSILTCKSEYAYGETGSSPTIGPNATLIFEVELLHWKSTKDITEEGQGGVLKTTLVEGQGYRNPSGRDQVLGGCHPHLCRQSTPTKQCMAQHVQGGDEAAVQLLRCTT